MFDRYFFPALVFATLFSTTAAFVADATPDAATSGRTTVVQLERVVVVAAPNGNRLALAESGAAAR